MRAIGAAQIKNGTIDGAPHTLVGCGVGIVNRPVAGGGAWAIIPAWGVTRGGFFSVSDGLGHTSVVAYCTGLVQIATIVNRTYMEIAQQNYSCQQTCIDPNDAHRWMWTHPPSSMITTDGGKSVVNLNHSNIWHCGIDRRGALYTAAMGGAYRSFDNGATWKAYYDVRVARRTNATRATASPTTTSGSSPTLAGRRASRSRPIKVCSSSPTTTTPRMRIWCCDRRMATSRTTLR